MTDLTPIECEARLVGLSKQRRKDGDWIEVKFHIHPDDHPAALFILPLGTDCTLSIKGVTASEKPTTETEAPKLKGGPICKRAVLLCKNRDFMRWWMGWSLEVFLENHQHAEILVKERMYRDFHIGSRAELDHNVPAAREFEQIEREFYDSQRGWSEGASR